MILTHYRIRVRCWEPFCLATYTDLHEIAGGLDAAVSLTRDAARAAGWAVNLDAPHATRCPTHRKDRPS